jgi:hypothetical protein
VSCNSDILFQMKYKNNRHTDKFFIILTHTQTLSSGNTKQSTKVVAVGVELCDVLARPWTHDLAAILFCAASVEGNVRLYESVSKTFRTGRLERELQMV